jgi:hypothetical protein
VGVTDLLLSVLGQGEVDQHVFELLDPEVGELVLNKKTKFRGSAAEEWIGRVVCGFGADGRTLQAEARSPMATAARRGAAIRRAWEGRRALWLPMAGGGAAAVRRGQNF